MNKEADELAKGYNFQTFDIIKDLKDRKNFAINITSRRNTGKSVLVRDLCSHIAEWYAHVYIVSLTSNYQPELYNFIDNANVITSFDEKKLEIIWNSQKTEVAKCKSMKTKEDDIPRILILFDDIISDARVRKSDILKRLYVMGRHIKISLILLTQTFTGVPPLMRTNADVAIAFHLNSYDDRDAFSRAYLSTKNNTLGLKIFDKITKEPFQALIVLNFLISQNPEDYVRVYTAKLKIPDFKMGLGGLKRLTHTLADLAEPITSTNWPRVG